MQCSGRHVWMIYLDTEKRKKTGARPVNPHGRSYGLSTQMVTLLVMLCIEFVSGSETEHLIGQEHNPYLSAAGHSPRPNNDHILSGLGHIIYPRLWPQSFLDPSRSPSRSNRNIFRSTNSGLRNAPRSHYDFVRVDA